MRSSCWWGAFDPRVAQRLIETYFGPIRNPSGPRLEAHAAHVQFGGTARARLSAPTNLDELSMIWTLPEEALQAAAPALALIGATLEGRLRERLARVERIAQQVRTQIDRQPGGARFEVRVGASRENALPALERAVDEELEAVRTRALSPIELKEYKQQAMWSLAFETEHVLAQAYLLVRERVDDPGASPQGPARYIEAIRALDAQDVLESAARLLPRERRLIVETVARSGARYGGEVVSIDGELFPSTSGGHP
jgi:predicted Zn-dependent peptidase